MHFRLSLLAVALALVLGACGSSGKAPRAQPAPPAVNDDGNPTTAIITARFDPANGVVPLPNNLLFSGTGDLTLNIPVANPSSPAAGPLLALNALDGWGTVTPWVQNFTSTINPATVVAGASVRWFEVALASPGGPVVGIVSELTPGVDYVTSVSTTNPAAHAIALVPLRPLKEITSYMAVITRDVTDMAGNHATPSQTYFIAQRTSPLVDQNGQSTDPLLPNSSARALEPLRRLTNAQEAAAASFGIPSSDIVNSWVATTQSITPVMLAARSTVGPQFSSLAPTGLTTAALGLAGIADIYIGVISLPYMLEAPSAANPTAPLNGRWEAAPGAYVPPFNALGFDPTSTNLTYLNPFPVAKSTQTVPVLVTVPNLGSGNAMPDSGWPVFIFQHGITGNRTNALGLADTMALAGFAVVAIDQPLHGIAGTIDPATGTPVGPEANPFYIENTPFGALAGERTFDVDYVNNSTGAPGPDGVIDSSGAHTINLASLLTARDNNRQASFDLSTLAATIPTMDITGDGLPDFDGSQIRFGGQSLGSIVGIPFVALEGATSDSAVNSALLSVPGGGIVGLLLGSPTFGPVVRGGLAAAGIQPGTADFESFVVAAQTVLDSADPINWGALAAATQPILVQEVVGSPGNLPDQVIPNAVPGFPLSGTEPLIRVMGLDPISQSTFDPAGIRGVARFLVGVHSSLLNPASLEATIEMQGQAASFAASAGTAVQVTVPSVLQGD